VFFETDKFSTRLAYNFRSEYMLNARDVIGKRPVYNTDRGVLDYSFTYNLTDTFKVGFDVNNLTNETTHTRYQYDQAGNLHPRHYFINDQRFTLRLSANF
jgi:outer membrane receptor protein involved in Fe transport